MRSGQAAPVLRRSSRIRAARQKSDPTPIKTNAVTTTESISTPREPSPSPPQPEKSLDSLTSASRERSGKQARTSPTLEESFASQMTLGPAPSLPVPLSQTSSFHGTQSSAHSCSPIPAHVSHRRKRRRRLPPLKNRLARIARPRLPRPSPPPHPERAQPKEESEYGEEEVVREEEEETKPVPVNVTQRRLAAPENFTIPDLKDLLGYKSTARPPQTPAPRFILPQNTVRSSRLTQTSKSPYAKRKTTHTPRLKFVALEAHHEQATARTGNAATRFPLTPQTSPVRRTSVFPRKDEMEDPVQNFSNRQPEPSPCRVLVKATPEPQELVPKLPSLMEAMSTHLTPEPEVEAQPSRSLAPMSELYDNLMKLAKSAEQMGRPVIPESSSLKRKLQATLTPQLTFEVTQPAKVARLR